MTVTAHYDSHRERYEREFETIDAAVAWLAQEEEIGEAAAVRIEAGGRVIEGAALRNRLIAEPVFSRDFLRGTF